MIGDFNAHHTAWGSEWCNISGNNIINFVDDKNLVILNDGSSTRFAPPGERISAVDLTLVSTSIAHKCEWKIHDDVGFSDHFPMILQFHTNGGDYDVNNNRSSRNIKKADWEEYYTFINNAVNETNINYNQLINIINDAADVSIPNRTHQASKPGCI